MDSSLLQEDIHDPLGPSIVILKHCPATPTFPPYLKQSRHYYAGQDLISVAEASQVAVDQIQRRPVVQTKCKPDHDEASAKGHLLLDCCVAVTFSTTPPDMQPTIVVMQTESGFITEQDLSPLPTRPPHVMPVKQAACCSVCGRQAWPYSWAT